MGRTVGPLAVDTCKAAVDFGSLDSAIVATELAANQSGSEFVGLPAPAAILETVVTCNLQDVLDAVNKVKVAVEFDSVCNFVSCRHIVVVAAADNRHPVQGWVVADIQRQVGHWQERNCSDVAAGIAVAAWHTVAVGPCASAVACLAMHEETAGVVESAVQIACRAEVAESAWAMRMILISSLQAAGCAYEAADGHDGERKLSRAHVVAMVGSLQAYADLVGFWVECQSEVTVVLSPRVEVDWCRMMCGGAVRLHSASVVSAALVHG